MKGMIEKLGHPFLYSAQLEDQEHVGCCKVGESGDGQLQDQVRGQIRQVLQHRCNKKHHYGSGAGRQERGLETLVAE